MALFLTILTSLIAGLLNAFSGVLQRRGIGTVKPDALYSKRQIAKTSKSSVWQLGVLAEGLAAVLELVALYFGSLLIVEPLLMTNLVFLLAFVHFRQKKTVTPIEWLGVVFICVGVSTFLVTANPHGGQSQFGLIWLAPVLIILAMMASGAFLARRIKKDNGRGAVGSFVGGLSLGLTAALTRLAMLKLHSGIVPLITHWPLYALIASSIISVFAIQAAYGSGPLKITQPVIEIISPLVSVILGLFIFGDGINTSALAVGAEFVSFVIVVVGVVILGSSKRLIKAETSPALI